MSVQLALSSATNDLIFPVGGGVQRVDKGRFVVQQVKSKLNTWLGEWALHPLVGWVNASDFEKNYELFNLEDRARSIILATQGVDSVTSIDSNFSNRTLTINVVAMTIYGEINLTVPWSTI